MRKKVEVSKDVFDKFLKDTPGLTFDGLRYHQREEHPGLTWNKPLAVAENGKFYLVKDS